MKLGVCPPGVTFAFQPTSAMTMSCGLAGASPVEAAVSWLPASATPWSGVLEAPAISRTVIAIAALPPNVTVTPPPAPTAAASGAYQISSSA